MTTSSEFLAMARRAVSMGDLSSAKQLLMRVLVHDPQDPGACHGLAIIEQQQGDLDAALKWVLQLERGLPEQAEAAFNVATMLMQIGRNEMAEVRLRRAIALQPDFVSAYVNLGNVMFGSSRFVEAEAIYRKAIAADSSHLDAHYNLALSLMRLGHLSEAETVLRTVVRLQPQYASAWLTLGSLHHRRGNYREAARLYLAAINVSPNYLDAHFNLGKALQDQGQPVQALAAYRRVLDLSAAMNEPGSMAQSHVEAYSGAFFNIGRLLHETRRFEDWLAHFASCPVDLLGDVRYAVYALEVGMLTANPQVISTQLDAIALSLGKIDDIGLLRLVLSLAQYLDVSQEMLYKIYSRFNELAENVVSGRRLLSKRVPSLLPGRRVRIGYVSPDFNSHIMGMLMYDVISQHDFSRFEVFLYDLDVRDDAVTQSFRDLNVQFIALPGPDPHDAASRIALDELDLLIDLAGHTSGANPLIFAYRPAPVQLTHLGYHGALGLSAVDFKITDKFADLEGNDALLVERLLPMAGCLMPFRRQSPLNKPVQRPDFGIPDGVIVFGVFVNPIKLSHRCLAVWREILEALPGSVLAFSPSHSWGRNATEACLNAVGISAQRVVFVEYGAESDLGRWRYRLVDIVLDTFPYSGGDTTVAALDMGVPVVTLTGVRQSERMSYSILSNLGVLDGVAKSEAEYVEAACRLALDSEYRANVSKEIVAKLVTSGIADMGQYTRNLEQVFATALERAGVRDAA